MAEETPGREDNPFFSNTDDLEDDEVKFLNNPVILTPEPIIKKYLTEVKEYTQHGNKFYFSDGDAKVEVLVVSDQIIRVRMAPHGVFLADFSYAVPNSEQRVTVFNLTENDEAYHVATDTVTCIINKKNFHISFANQHEEVISEDASAMHWEENRDFGGYYVYCTKKSTSGESFFGLGDKTTDFNLRGKRLVNWNSDVYSF